MPGQTVRTKSSSTVSPAGSHAQSTASFPNNGEVAMWMSAWECAFQLKHPDVITELRNTLLRA